MAVKRRGVAEAKDTKMRDGDKRVVIEAVSPEIDCGAFGVKRVVGEKVSVKADIFCDGHDAVAARLVYLGPEEGDWSEVPMRHTMNDRWIGEFVVTQVGLYRYSIEGWVDHFQTWQRDLRKKHGAGQDISVELLIGIGLLEEAAERARDADKNTLEGSIAHLKGLKDPDNAVTFACSEMLTVIAQRYPDDGRVSRYRKDLRVIVDRERAAYSAWYEMFPRSCPGAEGHATLRECEAIIPAVARMGFNVMYLPPVHPIGSTNRKGRNNAPMAEPDDVGSPWAIGSHIGGHMALHPELGKMEDFDRLVARAAESGMEVALDIAFQCSPDHPYVAGHPEWFRLRPDGTVQYAENPPKKYEDIFPLNFETSHWRELWEELRGVVAFWISRGVKIFRVDNPHTKPFGFWEWLIGEIKKDHPEVIFLSEAFTRPKVMYRLAKAGFTQSYTYFTWRNTKREITDYLLELTTTEVREYFRPNFWPNTPDILPEHLQFGGRPAFMARLVLAATLSSSYGIYGPPFELCVDEGLPGREEYLNAEKYEVKRWDWDKPGNLREFITRVNRIRDSNPALQRTCNLRFHEVDNDHLLFFSKTTQDLGNVILVVVNLDPFHRQSGWLDVPIDELGIDPAQPYLVHELLSDDKYIWQTERNRVELDPQVLPAFIFHVRRKLRRETDFDYFM